MDFNTLYKKLYELDTNECNAIMPPSNYEAKPTPQADSITMNVNMTGSGSGGIRELMNVLSSIDKKDSDQQLHGAEVITISEKDTEEDEEHEPRYSSTADLFKQGDDLHGKKLKEPPAVAGGGNPYQESLVKRLTSMYRSM